MRWGIPRNFSNFLSHFKEETFDPCFSRSRTRRSEEFCLIHRPFRGRDETLENLWDRDGTARIVPYTQTTFCEQEECAGTNYVSLCVLAEDLFYHSTVACNKSTTATCFSNVCEVWKHINWNQASVLFPVVTFPPVAWLNCVFTSSFMAEESWKHIRFPLPLRYNLLTNLIISFWMWDVCLEWFLFRRKGKKSRKG